MSEGQRTKVSSKADIGKATQDSDGDLFGNRLKVPQQIQEELEKEGYVHRFVSMKKITEAGGFHPMGWTPYTIKNPIKNPITGQAESIFRVGDLVLAVKTKEQHKKHLDYLKRRSQAQSNAHQDNVKAMRDKIKEGNASKHIALLEGDDEDEE
jgi:hypothetical protein